MKDRHLPSSPLIGTVLLAALLWFVTFALGGISFWVKISVSAATRRGCLFFSSLRSGRSFGSTPAR